MLPITSFAPFNGWHPPAVAGAPHWSRTCMHTFSATADGQLAHETDGVARAIVPPEGWDDYVKAWPDAAPIVAALRKPTPKAQPTRAAQRRSR